MAVKKYYSEFSKRHDIWENDGWTEMTDDSVLEGLREEKSRWFPLSRTAREPKGAGNFRVYVKEEYIGASCAFRGGTLTKVVGTLEQRIE